MSNIIAVAAEVVPERGKKLAGLRDSDEEGSKYETVRCVWQNGVNARQELSMWSGKIYSGLSDLEILRTRREPVVDDSRSSVLRQCVNGPADYLIVK